jgi:hypothetical protein
LAGSIRATDDDNLKVNSAGLPLLIGMNPFVRRDIPNDGADVIVEPMHPQAEVIFCKVKKGQSKP